MEGDEMGRDEYGQRTSNAHATVFTIQKLMEMLSFYEGELQARDIFIDQHMPQQSSSSFQSLHNQFSNPVDAIFRDSLLEGAHAARCIICGNKLLHIAKILNVQRVCDKKINKALIMMGKRFTKNMQELNLRERRIHVLAFEDEKYVKGLELERDELFEQLKQQHNEISNLKEHQNKMEEKLQAEKEREEIMVLYLLDEREKMLKEIQQLKASASLNNSLKKSQSSNNLKNTLKVSHFPEDLIRAKLQMQKLQEENIRLRNMLSAMQTEKCSLQKRLDYLMKDLQQSIFHQQFQFLQPKRTSEKELFVIDNGPIPSEHSCRIRSSSSFPQALTGDEAMNHGDSCRIHTPQHSSFNRPSTTGRGITSGTVTNTNSAMNVNRPPLPLKASSSSQQQQHSHRRRYDLHSNHGITYNKPPQPVIVRRSTSLPRRIINAATLGPIYKKSSKGSPALEHIYFEPSSSIEEKIVNFEQT